MNSFHKNLYYDTDIIINDIEDSNYMITNDYFITDNDNYEMIIYTYDEYDNIILVESKGIVHKYSFFNRLMREMKIRPVSFSKYCFGLSNLEQHLKKNNFKPLNRKVEKFQK